MELCTAKATSLVLVTSGNPVLNPALNSVTNSDSSSSEALEVAVSGSTNVDTLRIHYHVAQLPSQLRREMKRPKNKWPPLASAMNCFINCSSGSLQLFGVVHKELEQTSLNESDIFITKLVYDYFFFFGRLVHV